jgi:hypothetical protein
MKYLITREQFLSRSTGSNMINEVLENEITWGGSLLGRLINSTIRKVKIGYNESQIDQVLVDLRNELDYLLSASLTGDGEKKFYNLSLKKLLEEIKDTCLSTDDNNQKLEKLLGQSVGLYDPSNPKDNQEVGGIVGDSLKIIKDDLVGLDKIMGTDREKLLNLLSDFSDELRKLTYAEKEKGGNLSTTNYNRKNTINVLNRLRDTIMESNLIKSTHRLFGYLDFLESNQVESQNDVNKDSGVSVDNTGDVVDDNSDKNKDRDSKINSTTTTSTTTLPPSTGLVTTDDKKKSEEPKGIINDSNKSEVKEKIENLISKIDKYESEESLKNDDDIKKSLNGVIELLNKNKKYDLVIKIDNQEMKLSQYLTNYLKSINESFINFYKKNESIEEYDKEAKTVKSVWNRFLGPLDKIEPHRLTQNDVSEFEEMVSDPEKISNYFSFNPSLRPDPIISISRVFTNAYNLYATDYIPSGRPNGRVSQKTLREYIKLGATKNLTVSDAGYIKPDFGPWAVKSTFNKFRDGVSKLLQNQEYRKIFANMKFVAPGAEDKFNESFVILENEKTTTSTSKDSHGQLLLRFMNDMITPSKLGEFDDLKNTYISDYFGIKLSKKQKEEYKDKPEDQEVTEREKTNDLTWRSINQTFIKDFKDDKSSIFALPCKYSEFSDESKIKSSGKFSFLSDSTNKNTKVLFLNRVNGVENVTTSDFIFYPIRLTFNNQVLADKIKEDKNYEKITNFNIDSVPGNIHFGFISIKGSGEVILIHSSVTDSKSLKSEIKTIYIQKLKITDDIKVGKLDVNPSILIDGKIGRPYSLEKEYSIGGEKSPNKDNFDIKYKGGDSILKVMESEIKRIFD